MSSTRPRWLRLLVSPMGFLVLGLLVRLVHILLMGNQFFFGDTAEYEKSALRLLHGGGLDPNSPRAPLYPIFMAIGFKLGGEHNYLFVRLLKLVLSGVLIWIVTRQAQALGGRAVATVTAFAVALAPTLVFIAGMLYPTTMYTLIVAGMTLMAWRLSERPSWRRGVLLGVLMALGWLTDPVVIAPAAAVIGWLALRIPRRGFTLARDFVLSGVTLALVLAPYVVWRREAADHPQVFMAKAQYTLWSARTDSILSASRQFRYPRNEPFEALPMKRFLGREWSHMREHPAAFTHDVAWEFLHFFQPLPDRVQSKNRYNSWGVFLIGAIYFSIVLLLAPIGLFAGRAPARGRWLLAVVVLSVAIFYAFFFSQTRYRIPVEPELLVLAALGLCRLMPRLTAFVGGGDPDAAVSPS